MAAFTAARRDLAAALVPASVAGAADCFWERTQNKQSHFKVVFSMSIKNAYNITNENEKIVWLYL